jgi:hypothetical protein
MRKRTVDGFYAPPAQDPSKAPPVSTIEPTTLSDCYRSGGEVAGRASALRERLESLCARIDDPVEKLRCLRFALSGINACEPYVRTIPFAPVRQRLACWWGLETAARKLPRREVVFARNRARRVVGLIMLGGIAFAAVPGLAALQYRSGRAHDSGAVAAPKVANPIASTPPPTVEAHTVAEPLEQESLGIAPPTIWLADRGPGWELYSNGLRVEIANAVSGKPRRYVVHHLADPSATEAGSKPVGILFHTSESDLWPLDERHNAQLRQSSRELRSYLRRAQAYNYLIDRFGRVFRIVDDETQAAHAGNGIWARGDDIYVNLNAAFLGVAFESRWDGGRVLPITRAQLIAGRNLTNYLRQRFSIAPEMCVTHGLTSVSAARHLIGYHLDWARGFPFAAFGLPDLYAHPPPSVALMGFEYDEDFLRAVGTRWPGLIDAERAIVERARERELPPAVLKAERQQLYDRWRTAAPEAAAPDAAFRQADAAPRISVQTRGSLR